MSMDVVSSNYQNILDMARRDLKKIENKGTSKAETLEDLRNTTGKSFKTSDLEKLMEKYDPDAYAQYSKVAKGTDGARTQDGLAFLSKWIDSVKKGLNDGTISSGNTSDISKSNESKLSSKAQAFLENLRKQYGDYDFFIGNSTDDLKTLVKSGNKEFTVIFSNAELERMANDEEYAAEKMQSVEGAVKMSEEINQKYGFESAFGKNTATATEITKIGIVFNDDGTTTFFAELEKSSARQRERIEKAREEKRAEKKEEEKKAEKKAEKEIQSYEKSSADTKRTTVQANSMEELLEKMSAVDWDTVKAEKVPESGGKFDFSI